MEPGTHTQKNYKGRKHQEKTVRLPYVKLLWAKYAGGYKVQCTFSDGHVSVTDFEPALLKYAQGDYAKWLKPANFRKFKIERGTLVWGRNWDILFPMDEIYKGHIKL
jgi:hypothetical protein